jgi:hypothetical protein
MPSDFPDVATYRDILLGFISNTCLIDGASEVPASMPVKLCGQALLAIRNNYKMLKLNLYLCTRKTNTNDVKVVLCQPWDDEPSGCRWGRRPSDM